MDFERNVITAFLETAATAVGVGMVLGGFLGGIAGTLRSSTREALELRAVRAGYLGAAACLMMRIGDVAGI